MRQPETGRFWAELEVAAAEEWAAAEGVVWPEPEPDVDVESGDGVPYLFAVDGFLATARRVAAVSELQVVSIRTT